MERVRGKAKKSPVITNNRSGEEEKQPIKRRGRPTKAHKEAAKKINEKTENKLESQLDNENKRKRSCLETEESLELEMLEDENGVKPETNGLVLTKAVGFRHNGSRRKNKPQRAAEVGVSVCEVFTWLVLRS